MAAFAEALQRPPLLWDNYPVNDLAMQPEMHIGPIRGREPGLAQVASGVLVNTTIQTDQSCLRSSETETLERLTGAALGALERGEAATANGDVAALLSYLNGLDEAIYHLRNRMRNLALRSELLPWLELLEYWYLLGKRAINALEAEECGEPVERPLSLMDEARRAIWRHPKQIAGQELLRLADYVSTRMERKVTMTSIDPALLRTARPQAERVLLANGGELGLLGANQAYQQVWARDSMMAGLGLWLCSGLEGRAINRRSLETLRNHQSALGRIPHNVARPSAWDPALVAYGGHLAGTALDDGAVEDTAHAGVVDGNLWYILGHYYHYVLGGHVDFLRQAWNSLQRALLWLRYQDVNECGLLEVHEAMDWADLFANRYNVLYCAAWQCLGRLADALGQPSDEYRRHASDVRRKVNTLLWVGPEVPKDYTGLALARKEWLYPLKRVETELVERPFYLPYMAFRDFADRLDTLGNLLAIVFGVATQPQADKILDYIHGCGLDEPYPVRALYRVVQPGDKDWRDYYRVRNLNLPHHYHNGGAWPFIGGFYVAALVQAGRKAGAARQLDKLTDMVRQGRSGECEFNEWFHGQSGRPMGFARQSWSAAMYIFAQEAVSQGKLSVFNAQNGWSLAAKSG